MQFEENILRVLRGRGNGYLAMNALYAQMTMLMSRVEFNRHLAHMEREGLIEVDDDDIVHLTN